MCAWGPSLAWGHPTTWGPKARGLSSAKLIFSRGIEDLPFFLDYTFPSHFPARGPHLLSLNPPFLGLFLSFLSLINVAIFSLFNVQYRSIPNVLIGTDICL